ncbi:autotransporter outer membrane beta-barrel domain-containing protein [Brevundimonas sp. PAMC22021]|nr:autotransporter outer membrane beta-barrel domain-containing protein [Brevundimonas sp. PAMC22021]
MRWGEGGETVTGFDGEQTRDLAFDADRTGFQTGVDWLRGGSYWGLTSGVSRSEYLFQTSRTSVDVQAANLGAYAGWSGNGLRAEVLAKADALELRLTNPTAPFLETFDGLSTGVQTQVARRLGDQRIYVEPQAQLAYVHTRLDDFDALGAAITLDDVDAGEGRLGLRLGSNSGDLRPYVSAHAVQEWGGQRPVLQRRLRSAVGRPGRGHLRPCHRRRRRLLERVGGLHPGRSRIRRHEGLARAPRRPHPLVTGGRPSAGAEGRPLCWPQTTPNPNGSAVQHPHPAIVAHA